MIGEDISISVLSIEGGRVRLAISAPQNIPILRSELAAASAANRDAAAVPSDLLDLLHSLPEPPPASDSTNPS